MEFRPTNAEMEEGDTTAQGVEGLMRLESANETNSAVQGLIMELATMIQAEELLLNGEGTSTENVAASSVGGNEDQVPEPVAPDDPVQVSEGEIIEHSENESHENGIDNGIVECSQTDASEKAQSTTSRSCSRSSCSDPTSRSTSASPEIPRDRTIRIATRPAPPKPPVRRKPIMSTARRLNMSNGGKERTQKPAAKASVKSSEDVDPFADGVKERTQKPGAEASVEPSEDVDPFEDLIALGDNEELKSPSPSYQKKILGDGADEAFPDRSPLSADGIRKEISVLRSNYNKVRFEYAAERRSAETAYKQRTDNIHTTLRVTQTTKADKTAENAEKKTKLEVEGRDLEENITLKSKLLEDEKARQLKLAERIKESKNSGDALEEEIRQLEMKKEELQFVPEDTTKFDEIVAAKQGELAAAQTTYKESLKAYAERQKSSLRSIAQKLKFLEGALPAQLQLEQGARKRPAADYIPKIPNKKQARIVIVPEPSSSSAAGGIGVVGARILYAPMDTPERPRKTYTLLSERTAVYNCMRAVGQIKSANILKADDRKLKERMHSLRNKIHTYEQKMAKIFLGEKTARNQLLLDKKSIVILERIINGEIESGEKHFQEKDSILLNYDNHVNAIEYMEEFCARSVSQMGDLVGEAAGDHMPDIREFFGKGKQHAAKKAGKKNR